MSPRASGGGRFRLGRKAVSRGLWLLAAYRVRMTTAAKLLWIVLAVMLVLALLNAVSLALISPG
jgi:hypothetical protein